MAVEDKYADANVEANKKALPAYITGGQAFLVTSTIAIAAADDDGSVYRFAQFPANMIPVKIELDHSSITGGTDFEIGVYNRKASINDGAAVDIDVLLGTTSLAVAADNVDGKGAVVIADRSKSISELIIGSVAAVDQDTSYDLALTANTVGTAAGTVVIRMWLTHGQKHA